MRLAVGQRAVTMARSDAHEFLRCPLFSPWGLPVHWEVPVPAGTWKITANVLLPYFRWDKSGLDTGVRSETAFVLPPGPNNRGAVSLISRPGRDGRE